MSQARSAMTVALFRESNLCECQFFDGIAMAAFGAAEAVESDMFSFSYSFSNAFDYPVVWMGRVLKVFGVFVTYLVPVFFFGHEVGITKIGEDQIWLWLVGRFTPTKQVKVAFV
jgi:hypothetical protein